MKKIEEILEKRWASNCVAIAFGIILYLILSNINSIFSGVSSFIQLMSPLIIGVVLAYLMNPIVNVFETKILQKVSNENSRHNLSVTVTIVLILVIITLFFIKIIPSLFESMTGLISNIDIYKDTIEELLEKINNMKLGVHLDIGMITGNIDKWLDMVFEKIGKNINVILETSKTMGNVLLNWIIGFVLAVYFLIGKKSIQKTVDEFRKSALSDDTYRRHNVFFKRCHEILIQYISCNFMDGLIIGISNAIFMIIMKLPFAPLISVIVGVTNLLPTFGPIIGGVIGAFLLVINKPAYALAFIIFTCILQAIDGYVLKPKLFGGSLGIPAVLTLIAIIMGGKFFGVIGIFLGIPIAAVLTFTYQESFIPWLNERKEINSDEKSEQVADEKISEEKTETVAVQKPVSNSKKKNKTRK